VEHNLRYNPAALLVSIEHCALIFFVGLVFLPNPCLLIFVLGWNWRSSYKFEWTRSGVDRRYHTFEWDSDPTMAVASGTLSVF
jgi:hypothetical protein